MSCQLMVVVMYAIVYVCLCGAAFVAGVAATTTYICLACIVEQINTPCHTCLMQYTTKCNQYGKSALAKSKKKKKI